MGEFLFWVSYVLLWTLLFLLGVCVFALYRHHGLMLVNSREGRENQGPELHKLLPKAIVEDEGGTNLTLPVPENQSLFIFFGSTTCEPCKEARPALSAFAEKYKATIRTILICAGVVEDVKAFSDDLARNITVVPDPKRDLQATFRVFSTPFALITDEDGVVRGKGMPIESDAFEWFAAQLRNTLPAAESPPGLVPTAQTT